MIKYNKVDRYGKRGTEGTLQGHAYITVMEKLDGCFHSTTPILLSDGTSVPIGRIVKNKMEVEVMSYNFEKQQFEPKRVTNWYNHGKQKEFIAFKADSRKGSRANRVICTPDHLFYTDKGYVQAKNLTENHTMYTHHAKLSETQRQFILGTLLGDSSAYPNKPTKNNGVAYNHSDTQLEYKLLKDSILGTFFAGADKYTSGFGSEGSRGRSVCSLATDEVVSMCYKSNVKTVTKGWLDKLTPIGLSFWYMDDGSLSHNKSQRDRAVLHTQGFSEKETDTVVSYLWDKWGIASSKVWDKSGHFVALDTDGSDRFFTLIAPYIHSSMQYKLPKNYRSDYCYWDDFKEVSNNGLVETRFRGFTTIPDYIVGRDNYDIGVEDNHNYLANGVLAHNSNASFKKEDGKLRAFSRNKELDDVDGLRGFREWVETNHFLEGAKEGYIYYGEWLIKHTINYPKEAYDNFYLFDVYDEENEEFLTMTDVSEQAHNLDLLLCPVLYEGKFKDLDHLKGFIGKSMIGADEGEGIVVKNYNYRDREGKQLFTKFVSDAFAEKAKTKIHNVKKGDAMDEFVETYLTEARVEKIVHKLIDEGLLHEQPDITDMGTILKNSGGRISDDILEEEMDSLIKLAKQGIGKAYPNVLKGVILNMQENR